MKVSVIIPSYNGANKIGAILEALKTQSYHQFEVIVVDDGSTDNTLEMVNGLKSRLKSLRVVQQDNGGRAAARNRGVNEANGKLLIFYDDDTRPAFDSIRKHVEFHASYQNAIVCGFPVEDEEKVQSDIQRYKLFLSRKWTSVYKKGINPISDTNIFLTSANMSLSKDIFDNLGGFNEKLTDAEDIEFGSRAISKGISVFFDKSNIAWHDDLITCAAYIRRQRQYQMAHMKLQRILSSEPTFTERQNIKLTPYKAILFSLLSRKYLVDLIDKDGLVWLPRRIRFKIYDLVITGLSKVHINRLFA